MILAAPTESRKRDSGNGSQCDFARNRLKTAAGSTNEEIHASCSGSAEIVEGDVRVPNNKARIAADTGVIVGSSARLQGVHEPADGEAVPQILPGSISGHDHCGVGFRGRPCAGYGYPELGGEGMHHLSHAMILMGNGTSSETNQSRLPENMAEVSTISLEYSRTACFAGGAFRRIAN